MYVQFTASQSVEIPVEKEPLPIQHYLRQPLRLVHALVDPTRCQPISADCFRLKMRPLDFLTVSIQPTVDLKVWAKADGTVYLQSVGCEIRGVEYIDRRFHFNLVGGLYSRQINGITHLKGQADLTVGVELPPPFTLTPKAILETTGNGLLKSVLLTIKQRLMHQLLLDYHQWANAETEGAIIGVDQVLANGQII